MAGSLPSSSGHDPVLELLLACADDKLLRGHLNSDWTGLAPMLEEDIAFSSLAQDDIAHAQALYELAAPRAGKDADQLAFGRDAASFRSASMMELPDEFDWAFALARQLYTSHFDGLRLRRLSASSLPELARLARRLAAEQQVHVDHADAWISRLGRGSAEARERLQAAFDALAPHAAMLFEPVPGQGELESAGAYPPLEDDMFDLWSAELRDVLEPAGIALRLERSDPDALGGRRGAHTEALARILGEMTEVFAIAPDSPW